MADKHADRPEFQTMKGRQFGPDEEGRSFARNFAAATAKGLSMGSKDNKVLTGILPVMMAALASQIGSMAYLSMQSTTVAHDPQIMMGSPDAGLSVRNGASSDFFGIGLQGRGDRPERAGALGMPLVLMALPSGDFRLYYATGMTREDSRLVYVADEETALRLTADMARHLRDLDDKLRHDLGNLPANIPAPFAFERVSQLYADGDEIYRVGDNFRMVRGAMTPQTISTQADLWSHAAQQFAGGRFDHPDKGAQDIPQAELLPDIEEWLSAWGLTLLGVYGGFAAACAAGGLASANRKSRRRASGPK